MLTMVVLALVGQMAAGVFDATTAKVSAPAALTQIESGKLKGNPLRLAWGDQGQLFLRSAETDKWGNERGRNYVLSLDKPALVQAEEQPAWAALYWNWKSGISAPGVPVMRFDIETREQSKTATGSTQEGGSGSYSFDNPNKSDPSQSQIAKDVASMQKIITTTVKLKGQLIVESQNMSVPPGTTFGWAPSGLGALAYADSKKKLVLVDREGRKFEVPNTEDVLLPAWSPDGTRIAYLQRKDRKTYILNIVTVTAAK